MPTTGDVELTILDGGGSVVVPGANVQVIIGAASAGPVDQVVATRSIKTLTDLFVDGPLVQSAAARILAGATVLAMRAATNTAGSIRTKAGATVSAATNATPIAITTDAAHGYVTGDVVTIADVAGNTAANGTFIITKTSDTAFTLNGSVGSGVYTSGGTVTHTGVNAGSATGTSMVTLTGTPVDSFYVKVKIVTGGTIAAAGIKFQFSLDAGRNYSPVIALGTNTTYLIPGTGVTLNFAAGTLVTNNTYTFSTIEPTWNPAGVQACLNALQASQYAVNGWGSMHIVGAVSGANASTIQGYLETLASGKIFTRAILESVDASPPAAYGGTAQTEAAWMTAVMNDFSTVSAKRVCTAAGYYNMPSAIPVMGTTFRTRRSLAWSLAARQVQIPPQRHAGRVKDGSLADVVIDPTNDPTDGFIYHDERLNPGFNDARFTAAKTRIKKKGFFIDNPKLMADTGSVFTLLPIGNVMDIACGIVNEVGTEDINEDVRLNDNGTIFDNEALAIEQRMRQALKDNMVNKNMLSSMTVAVDRTNNVESTSEVNVAVTLRRRGYVLQENIVIGYGSAAASS